MERFIHAEAGKKIYARRSARQSLVLKRAVDMITWILSSENNADFYDLAVIYIV